VPDPSPSTPAKQDVIDALYRAFHPRLVRQIRSAVVGPAELAEDAAHFAWAALLEEAEMPPAPEGWLVVTGRRQAWRLVRDATRDTDLDHSETRDPRPDPRAAVDRLVAARLEAHALLTTMPRRRAELLIRHARGDRYREICGDTGLSYTTVNRQLAKAARDVRRHRGQG
jgi:DNA-directed RNA polymerase specialized sigma24 family protein